MRDTSIRFLSATAVALLVATNAAPASAQGDTLAGKTVQMIIGFGPGGGYDLWGRTVARHIGRHLPGNPNVVPQNMPGAGSYTATNYIYNVAPKDGTVLGIIARDAALGPLSGAPGARFDATRLSWIGTPTKETNVCIAFHTAKVKTLQDLYQQQLILGDTGPGTGTRSYPKVLNDLLGMKFKLVERIPLLGRGLPGDGARRGRGHLREPRQHHRTAVRTGYRAARSRSCSRAARSPIPTSRACRSCSISPATTSSGRCSSTSMPARASAGRSWRRRICRPTRLKMLRDAFNATMKDASFAEEAHKSKLDLEPEDGEHLAALIAKIYATPKPIVDKIANLIK